LFLSYKMSNSPFYLYANITPEPEPDPDPTTTSASNMRFLGVELGMFEFIPVICPLCSNEMTFGSYFIHLAEDHPISYNFWMYFYGPDASLDVDRMSYEDLSNLCQIIGNHTPGLTQEQKETATVPFKPTQSEEADLPRCTICLSECRSNNTDCVRINHCGHPFCRDCLFEWLNTHKTCPLCIQEIS
jgi:Ring finger domain